MYSPRRRTRSISLEMLAGIVLLLVVLAFLLGFLLGGRSMKHRMEAEEDSVVRTVRETVAEAVTDKSAISHRRNETDALARLFQRKKFCTEFCNRLDNFHFI